jgi:hypothetical protein
MLPQSGVILSILNTFYDLTYRPEAERRKRFMRFDSLHD